MMKKRKVQELNHGLYKIYWKSGGSSLASVGSDRGGARWMAPVNWVSPISSHADHWKAVRKIKLIKAQS